MRTWGLWWAAVACTGAPVVDDDTDDTDPVVVDCATTASPALEFAQELASGPMADRADVDIGIPPQGGAPYAPFELRLRAELDDLARLDAHGEIVDAATDELLGDITESKAFLCANVGVHAGWRYGGELHVRFWDRVREELDGRSVRVELEVALPDTTVVGSSHPGTLRWTLDEGDGG